MFGGLATDNALVSIRGTAPSTVNYGIFFNPSFASTTAGVTLVGFANATFGALFGPADSTGTNTTLVGGLFYNDVSTAKVRSNVIGGIFRPAYGTFAAGTAGTPLAQGNVYGWLHQGAGGASGKHVTFTATYGGYISIPFTSLSTGGSITNAYGLYVEEQIWGTTKYGIFLANATTGYKALAIRDTNTWIGSDAAGQLDIGATSFKVQSTNIGFYNVAPVARATTGIAAAAFTANSGTAVNDASTFGGYTLKQVVQALQSVGILT